ncbi:hypothetical protein IFM89_003183, partial [Coptis chinensis]
MAHVQHHCIADIDSTNREWKIMARVTRLWQAVDYTTDEVNSLDMLLIDEHGHQIHARVDKSLMKKFKRHIVENEIYSLDRFSLLKNDKKYNVILGNFDQIPSKIDNKNLSDVVGRVYEWNKLKNIVKKMDIKLFGYVLKITLWSNSATQFDDDAFKDNSNASVLIVTSTSVRYDDEYHEYVLSSTAATKLYLNLQISQVTNIINSPVPAQSKFLLQGPLQPPSSIAPQPLSQNKKTLSDVIASANDASSQQNHFTCEAIISKILHDKGWTYNACPHSDCLKVVNNTSNGYSCTNHGIVSPEQRYQLRMEIKDETSTARVVAFRDEAMTLLQKTEKELAHIESQ